MASDKRCEVCGGVVPEDSPAGECPGCLLGAGLGAGEGGGSPLDRAELEGLFPGLEIGEFVGRGGMGLVYKATQRSLGRPVALKLLLTEVAGRAGFAERFNREARALARLNHPNIVGIHESGRAGDHWYFIMEYVDGVNLRQAMTTGGMTSQEALAIVPQVCDALQYAHDMGVVHRDIKPENILLDQQGRVKIADFGLAKLRGDDPADHTLTREQQAMGTYHYIAPEQLRNAKDVDHRADIYSLGVVFYEMLTGQLPMGNFPRPSQKVKVDVHLDQVVLRAMEQEREQRYQRVEEFKTGIECPRPKRSCGRRTSRPTPPPVDETSRESPRELSRLAITGILGIPVGALAVLIARLAGVEEETPLAWLFGGVALIGIFFSALGWNAIRASSGRLGGLTLARLGSLYPVVLLGPALVFVGAKGLSQGGVIPGVAGLLGLGLFLVSLKVVFGHRPRPAGIHVEARSRSATAVFLLVLLVLVGLGGMAGLAALLAPAHYTDSEGNRHIIDDNMTLLPHEAVLNLLAEIEKVKAQPVVKPADLDRFYHPAARKQLRSLSAKALAAAAARGELGLGQLDTRTLPVPLTAFEFASADVGSQRVGGRGKARVFIRYGDLHIGFPLAFVSNQWYLDLGKLERYEKKADGPKKNAGK